MIIHLVNSSSDTSDICLLLGIKVAFHGVLVLVLAMES